MTKRFGGGVIGFGKIPWFILIAGFVLIWCRLLPFFNARLIALLMVQVFFLILIRLMQNSERLGFPIFCRSGQRETSLDEFSFEVDGWLPLLPVVDFPRLTGQLLADVLHRKGVSAGDLDGWGWREFKVLPISWFDQLACILTKVEDLGIWPDGLLDAYIAMIPKAGGDATPLGQRPLSVLPVVYRIWASARMGELDDWFRSWVPDSVFSAGGGRGSVEAWYTSALDIEEVLSGVADSHVHLIVADVVKSFDTVVSCLLRISSSC